jgi:tRNA dimethylallyltransferase
MTVLALLGPTASGKSRVALATARARSDVEVVAVDAFTVYRGMDVGTAKPTAEERARVAHHLVDVIDPDQELTVAQFQAMAREAIDDVRARGRVPLLVGGSGLYWRAVVDDLRFPPTDAAVRSRIERRWEHDTAGAHAHLLQRDPAAAGRIDPANLRRTVRALEVLELTGEPFSAFSEAWDRFESIYDDLDVALLDPPAERLREAIDLRSRRMVEAGLLDEARALRSRWTLSRTALQAIGYAEAFAVLDGQAPAEGLAEAVARRTRRYARRQRSWFRRDPRCTTSTAEEIRRRWAGAQL